MNEIDDLKPYFPELDAWPIEFSISAALWPMLSDGVKEALKKDIAEAGYDWRVVKAVEYMDGRICSVTVRL